MTDSIDQRPPGIITSDQSRAMALWMTQECPPDRKDEIYDDVTTARNPWDLLTPDEQTAALDIAKRQDRARKRGKTFNTERRV